MARKGCIITGCVLCLYGQQFVVGDLFRYGDRFVFNANVDADWKPLWVPETITRHYPRQVHIPAGLDYFERRGVFVMPADTMLLNREALEYLGGEL